MIGRIPNAMKLPDARVVDALAFFKFPNNLKSFIPITLKLSQSKI